ncbi:thermonuclease family protein [Ruegeria arenilitoris]|uniref:thermonuclease family protein n=1 Tax=Ruegeria arenilitoris TaxID=1173585 RepID=UPI003464CB83
MPFTPQQLSILLSGIERALTSTRLTKWERDFLRSVQQKLNSHGEQTRLSTKQYRVLMRLIPAERETAKVVDFQREKNSRTAKASTTLRHRPYTLTRHNYRTFNRRAMRLFLLSAAGLALLAFFVASDLTPYQAIDTPEESPSTAVLRSGDLRVIDGDTVRVKGISRNVRLVGFNSPEVFSPDCAEEKRLGERATSRLKALLRSAKSLRLEYVRCACKPGTEGTQACNYGRLCGRLYVNEKDVGDTLIAEGLAAPYRCGRFSCPRPPGNWCG